MNVDLNIFKPYLLSFSRKKVMQLSHSSIVSYHKCIKDLEQYGYIEYIPSYHPALGRKVYLL